MASPTGLRVTDVVCSWPGCPCHDIVWHEQQTGRWDGVAGGELRYKIRLSPTMTYTAARLTSDPRVEEVIGQAVQLESIQALCQSDHEQILRARAAIRAVSAGAKASPVAAAPPVAGSSAAPTQAAVFPRIVLDAAEGNGVCRAGSTTS